MTSAVSFWASPSFKFRGMWHPLLLFRGHHKILLNAMFSGFVCGVLFESASQVFSLGVLFSGGLVKLQGN